MQVFLNETWPPCGACCRAADQAGVDSRADEYLGGHEVAQWACYDRIEWHWLLLLLIVSC